MVAKIKTLVQVESLETTFKEEQERSKRVEDDHQIFKMSAEAKVKHLEEQLQLAKEKAIKDHLNSDEFQRVEVIRPTYLLGFTDGIEMAAKSLSEENATQLIIHDNYNPNAKRLAGIMAQGLRDRVDLQKEKRSSMSGPRLSGTMAATMVMLRVKLVMTMLLRHRSGMILVILSESTGSSWALLLN